MSAQEAFRSGCIWRFRGHKRTCAIGGTKMGTPVLEFVLGCTFEPLKPNEKGEIRAGLLTLLICTTGAAPVSKYCSLGDRLFFPKFVMLLASFFGEVYCLLYSSVYLRS